MTEKKDFKDKPEATKFVQADWNSFQPIAPPLKLLKKLHKVMTELEGIAKTGYNEFHKYKYATEADVMHALRDRLIENNLFILPTATNIDVETSGSKFLTNIAMGYTIYDVESGESLETSWLGQGIDSGDKGLYKAFTGGHKYFLMKTFFLPTDADPEADPSSDIPPGVPQTNTQLATDKQKARLTELVVKHDVEFALSCEIDDKIRRGILTLGEAKEYADQLKKLPKLEDSRESK